MAGGAQEAAGAPLLLCCGCCCCAPTGGAARRRVVGVTAVVVAQEELLAGLSHEWRAREARREEALGKQRRALAALDAELRAKLAEISAEQKRLREAEAELAVRAVAIEQHSEREQAKLEMAVAREHAELSSELAAAKAALKEAQARAPHPPFSPPPHHHHHHNRHRLPTQARAETVGERLVAAEAAEMRHVEESALFRDAQNAATARALALQAEVGRLDAALKSERSGAEQAIKSSEERKQQALTAHRELAKLRAHVAAAEEGRLREALQSQAGRRTAQQHEEHQ